MDNLHLCPIIEAVEATMCVKGVVVRVIVPAEALQELYGATAEARTWLGATERNLEAIERTAKERFVATGKNIVIL